MQKFIEYFKELSPQYRFLKKQRAEWGTRIDKYRDMSDAAQLFDLKKASANVDVVEDDTWSDLDMDQVFQRIDACITPLGRQYLYNKLRTLGADPQQLKIDYQSAMALKDDTCRREKIQLILAALKHPDASKVTELLFDEPPKVYFPRGAAITLAGMVPLTGVLVAFSLIPVWSPAIFILANFFFSQYYFHAIERYSNGFMYLKYLLGSAKKLSIIDTKETTANKINAIENLKKFGPTLKRLTKKSRSAGINAGSAGVNVDGTLAYFLNLLCLMDFLVFIKSKKLVEQHKFEFAQIFNEVASLDAAISIASYSCQIDTYCNPSFGEAGAMAFQDLMHPLLDDAVPNSFSTNSRSALITGSNMAGKTTFIKTVGVNLILAQTLWLCLAESACIPLGPVYSSIKRADSLQDGKSYYWREIEALLAFVKTSSNRKRPVFLIDEILRGTNTIERLAASTAILEVLSGAGIVLVTTHDLELSELLSAPFDLYHFQESTDLHNMFDYKIRDGKVTSRNAISLLEQIGFPTEIVQRARDVAKALSSGEARLSH